MKSMGKIFKVSVGGLVLLVVFALVSPVAAQEDTWETKAPLLAVPIGYGVAINGKLYVVSHFALAGHNKVQEYDPATDTWTFRAEAPNYVGETAAAALGGKLYVIGGCPNANCASVTNLL